MTIWKGCARQEDTSRTARSLCYLWFIESLQIRLPWGYSPSLLVVSLSWRFQTDAKALIGILVLSMYGVHARGITHPNMAIISLTFFGGVAQFIVGIIEVFTGNTVDNSLCDSITSNHISSLSLQFGATVFTSYGAFNLSFAMIFYPGSGIIAAYTDPSTGTLTDEFNQALAIYLLAWMILTIIYAIAGMRASLILVADLSFLSLEFL